MVSVFDVSRPSTNRVPALPRMEVDWGIEILPCPYLPVINHRPLVIISPGHYPIKLEATILASSVLNLPITVEDRTSPNLKPIDLGRMVIRPVVRASPICPTISLLDLLVLLDREGLHDGSEVRSEASSTSTASIIGLARIGRVFGS